MTTLKRFIKFIIIVALLVIGIYVLCVVIERVDKKKFNSEFKSLLKLREELIFKIKNNDIEIDEYKIAKLPKEYEKVATNGQVLVQVNTSNKILIGFLYKPGSPDEDQYVFYSTEDEDFIKEQVGYILCDYIEKITDNWFFVQYN